MTAPALVCEGMIVRRGGRTLLDVSALAVAPGETLAIFGPNGAGKSTLLGILGLVAAPDAGAVRALGESAMTAAQRRRLRRRVLLQMQESILLSGTVSWNVGLPLRLRGVAASEVAGRVARWLDAFGVGDLGPRQASDLSGGEARRVCLARAFAADTDALLLDEPLAAIDARFREEIVDRLATVLRERKRATVVVTHDLGEALRLADRLAVMIDGRIRQIGRPEDVLSAPADPDVARLVGVETYLHGTGDPDGHVSRVRVGPAAIAVAEPVAAGEPVWIAIRPEDVALFVGDAPPEGSAHNALRARVTDIASRGTTALVRLDAGFPLAASVLPGTLAHLGLRPGVSVWALIKATAVRRV